MWPKLLRVGFFRPFFLCFRYILAALSKLDVHVEKLQCLSLFPSPMVMWLLSLQLKVSGKNLLNVCKLIFKISRSEKNDSLIRNDSILGEYYSVRPFSKCYTWIWMKSLESKVIINGSWNILFSYHMQKLGNACFFSVLLCVFHVSLNVSFGA